MMTRKCHANHCDNVKSHDDNYHDPISDGRRATAKTTTEEWTRKSTQWNKGWLDDPDRRRSDTKAIDMESKNSQEDQNQRRAVVT